MKLYFVSNQENLNTFKSILPKRFNNEVSVHGSNSMGLAVDEIIRKAPIDPYDLVIVTNRYAVSEDLESGGKISQRLNDACKFALKDTPIYFLVPAGNKTFSDSIKNHFNSSNANIYHYNGKMRKEDIEAVIKKVASTYQKDEGNQERIRQVVATVATTQESVPIGESYFGQTILAGVNLADKQGLLQMFSKHTRTAKTVNPEEKLKRLNEIRSKIVSKAPESITLEEVVEQPLTSVPDALIEIGEEVKEYLTHEAIKETLSETDGVYNSLVLVKDDIDSAIENIKDKDGQETVVLELMTAKSDIITKMAEKESDYIVEITNEISTIVQEQFNSASSLTRLNLKGLDLGRLGNDIQSIEIKKDLRDSLIKQVEQTSMKFVGLIGDISSGMNALGGSYTKEIKQLQEQRKDYANSKGIVLNEVALQVNTEVLTTLQSGYKDVYGRLGNLQESSKDMVKSFAELIHIDNNIINQQSKVINDLVQGNVKKVVNVGSTLEAKSIVVTGNNGAGKTVTAISLAKSFSERGMKVAVIDLDLTTPSIHLYSRSLKVGYEVFMQDVSFKFDDNNTITFVTSPTITQVEFDLDKLFSALKQQINELDRIIYVVNLDDTSLPEYQRNSKATILVSDSDINNVYDLNYKAETVLAVTQLNTIVVNKCSQPMAMEVANLLTDIQLKGIAVVPVLYYSKFDFCKLKNIEPYSESAGIITTMNQVMSSIE